MRVAAPSHAPPARFRAHDNAIFDATWMANDTRIVSASGDATVRVFDPETLFRTALCRGATQSVKCVRTFDSDGSGSDAVLVSSGRDGAIRLHDLRVPSVYDPTICREMFHKPVFEVQRAHAPPIAMQATPTKRRRIAAPDPFASVTSVAMVPGRPNMLFSSGAADGSVKLWDVRVGGGGRCGSSRKVDTQCVESITPSEEPRGDSREGRRRRHGIASLDVDVSGTKLLASSTDSSIYIYDTAQLGLGHSQVLSGHTATSFYVRASFSPCGRFVASGSADSMGYIWDLEGDGGVGSCGGLEGGERRPIVQLDGHRGGDVSVVEWCKSDMFKVVTCGDDTTVKVWRAHCGDAAEDEDKDERVRQRARESEGGKDEGYGVSRALNEEEESCSSEKRNGRSLICSKRLRDTDIRSFFGNKSSSSNNSRKRQKSTVNISRINSANMSL